jgi:uncharacterized protein (TIGR02246 family)
MSPKAQGATHDQQAIRELVAQFIEAWNRDDVKTMAAAFADDGDLIDPGGRVARGKDQLQRMFADEHAGHFKATRFNLTPTHLTFLKPDVALADYEFEIDDVKGPRSTFKGLVTFVLRQDAGKWLIASARPMAPVPKG